MVHAGSFFWPIWHFPAPFSLVGTHLGAVPEGGGIGNWGASSRWVPAGGCAAGEQQTPVQPKVKPAQTARLAVCSHL